MSTKGDTKSSSDAVQQKAAAVSDLTKLTNEQLHQETLEARNKLFDRCVETHNYIADVLVPRCKAIIARYKMQGVAAKDRPNGMPTVEAYFKSIGLNYNNVRSWIRRKRLKTEMFQSKAQKKCAECCKVGGHAKWCSKYKSPTEHLTELEAKLIGKIWAGNDVVEALERSGNVDEALKAYKEQKPTFEQVKDYIQRPVKTLAENLRGLAAKKLATALCTEIRRLVDDSGNQENVRICDFSYDSAADCFAFRVEILSNQQSHQIGAEEVCVLPCAQPADALEGGGQ